MAKPPRIDTAQARAAAEAQLRLLRGPDLQAGAADTVDWPARCLELVLAALDEPAEVDQAALSIAVRVVAGRLQQQAPGHSVEVRVPGRSGTAFQCGEGPQHTRGTPPNVVEMDPVTFVRLGAGRLDWGSAVASGVVHASGGRADLSALLPVVKL